MQQPRHSDAPRAMKISPMSPSELAVLVVDSNQASRDGVCQLLRDCSYTVYSCAVDSEAVDWLTKQLNIKLVLKEHEPSPSCNSEEQSLSLQQTVQPDHAKCDGTSLLRRLARCSMSHVPVVLLSSNGEREEVMRCLTLGAVDYLVKPLRHNELKHIWARLWCWKQSGLPIDSCPTTRACADPSASLDSLATMSDRDEEPTSNDGSAPNNNGQGSNDNNGQGSNENGSNGPSGDNAPGSHDNGSNDNGTSRVKMTEGGGSGGGGNGSSGNDGTTSPSAAAPHASSHNFNHHHRSSHRHGATAHKHVGGSANGASSIFLDPQAPPAGITTAGSGVEFKAQLPSSRLAFGQGSSQPAMHQSGTRKRAASPDRRKCSGGSGNKQQQLMSPTSTAPSRSAGQNNINGGGSIQNDGSDDTHGPLVLQQQQQQVQSNSPTSGQLPQYQQRSDSAIVGGGGTARQQVQSSGGPCQSSGGGLSVADALALVQQQASVTAALLAQQQQQQAVAWRQKQQQAAAMQQTAAIQQQLQAAAAMQGGQWAGMPPSNYPGYGYGYPNNNSMPFGTNMQTMMPYMMQPGAASGPGSYGGHPMGMPMMHKGMPMAPQQASYSLSQPSCYSLSHPSYSQASQGVLVQEPAVTTGLKGVGLPVPPASSTNSSFNLLLRYMAQTGQVPPQLLFQQMMDAGASVPAAPAAALHASGGMSAAAMHPASASAMSAAAMYPASGSGSITAAPTAGIVPQLFMPPATVAAAAVPALVHQEQQQTALQASAMMSGLPPPSSASHQLLNASTCAAMLMRLPNHGNDIERRTAALARYREKRHIRKYGKVIRYQSRHQQARQRPRIKGQFVKNLAALASAGDHEMAAMEDMEASICDEGSEDVEDDAAGVAARAPADAPLLASAARAVAAVQTKGKQVDADDDDLVEALRHLRDGAPRAAH